MTPILNLFSRIKTGEPPTIVGVQVYNGYSDNKYFPVTRLTINNDPNNYVNVNNTTDIFDSIYPWKGMEEYNIISNGTIYKKGTDANFSRNNDTYVYIPEFYYNVVSNENYLYYYISDAPRSEFEKHPGSNRYISKYPLNSSNISRTGVYADIYSYYPISSSNGNYTQSSVTPSNWAFPSIINKSVTYGQFAPLDIATLSAYNLLFLIETAGFSWMRDTAEIQPIREDYTSGSHYITDYKFQNFYWTNDTKYKTGSTDSISGHTGYSFGWSQTGTFANGDPADTRNFYNYKYRNIENLSNGGEIISQVIPIACIFEAGNDIYINTNPLQYAYNSNTYTTLTHGSFTGDTQYFGFEVTTLKYFPNKKWLFYPQRVSGQIRPYDQIGIYISGTQGWYDGYITIARDKREDTTRQAVYIGSEGISNYPFWPNTFSYVTGEYTYAYSDGSVVGNMKIIKRAIYIPPET